MGATTNTRKRGEDYFIKFPSLNSPSLDLHGSKKLKFSQSMQSSILDQPISSKSAASRISRYPANIAPIKRAVHAPCRVAKLGFFRANSDKVSNGENSDIKMGNFSSKSLLKYSAYKKARSEALGSLRFREKSWEEVIDVDEYEEKAREPVKNDVLEDSSSEEVEIVENGTLMELDRKIQRSCSSVVSEDLTNANLKSDSARKVLDAVAMERQLDVPSVPFYKKLYNSAGKRNDKLGRLDFEIKLNEGRLSTFQLYPHVKKQEEDVVREPFVSLTKEEEDEVTHALSNGKRRKILVTHENCNIEITGELLQCLKPGAWLNDEVINVYLELLKERETREPQKFLKCHFFNTFFYKKLMGGRNGYDFKSVRRWTTQRKLGYSLLECDKIFVPIHKEIHWCLAVINKKDEKFQYLDSLKGIDKQVLKVLARYYMDEVKDKSGKEIDVSSWKQEYVRDLPQQENGYDCGVFMVKYADFYSRDIGLCFNQEHMPYFRRRTAKEILRLKAE